MDTNHHALARTLSQLMHEEVNSVHLDQQGKSRKCSYGWQRQPVQHLLAAQVSASA